MVLVPGPCFASADGSAFRKASRLYAPYCTLALLHEMKKIQPYQDNNVWAHATYIYSILVEIPYTRSMHSTLTKTCTENDISGSPFHCRRYGNVDKSFDFRKVDIFGPCSLLTTGFWYSVAKIWSHDNMTKNKEGTLFPLAHVHTKLHCSRCTFFNELQNCINSY